MEGTEMITEKEMLQTLTDCAPGTTLFVGYTAGHKGGKNSEIEMHRAVNEEGINPTHFTGTLEGIKTTKKGEVVLLLWVNERDSVGPDGLKQGNFRSFNPNLGTLRTLQVLERMPLGAIAL
jgi:hypothetical protein